MRNTVCYVSPIIQLYMSQYWIDWVERQEEGNYPGGEKYHVLSPETEMFDTKRQAMGKIKRLTKRVKD